MAQSEKKKHWQETEDILISKSGRGLITYARYFKMPQFSLDILEGDIEKAKLDDPEQYANLESQTRQRDARDIITYAKDAIAAWIVEDITVVEFRKLGFMLSLNGVDRERKFTPSKSITYQPDFILTYNGKDYPAELASTLEDSWIKFQSIWLRINKKNAIWNNGTLLIGADMYTQKFVLVSPYQEDIHTDVFNLFSKPGVRVFWPNGYKTEDYETLDPKAMDAIIKMHCFEYDKSHN